jgi:hypothetical protein
MEALAASGGVAMTRYTIPVGVGFDVSGNFARAPRGIELLEPVEYGPAMLRGYVHAWPDSSLEFMRRGDSRGLIAVTVKRRLLREE